MCSMTFGPAIFPSLVIWPTKITGVWVRLANWINSAVHSLIWDTLPGLLSMYSVCRVWMESMMTTSGTISPIWWNIFWVCVSLNTKQWSFLAGIRSALSLIWRWLSSPDTYKTLYCSCKDICSKRVDFPIPGSPPNRVTEPGTSPPPKTLSNSSSGQRKRLSLSVVISAIGIGRLREGVLSSGGAHPFLVGFSTTSSTRVFHSLQLLHCPCHWGCCAPHFWQKKAFLTLLIG